MKYLLSSVFLISALAALLSGCGNNNAQSIPINGAISPYGVNCVAGQPCAPGVVPTCAPGTAGCYTTGGYVQFSGNLSNVNNSVAKSIAGGPTWCIGNCYAASSVEMSLGGGTGQVTLNINGYPIGGQAVVVPMGNGSDVQVNAYGAGRIDIISNQPLDGSVPSIAQANVELNGQHLGYASLVMGVY